MCETPVILTRPAQQSQCKGGKKKKCWKNLQGYTVDFPQEVSKITYVASGQLQEKARRGLLAEPTKPCVAL